MNDQGKEAVREEVLRLYRGKGPYALYHGEQTTADTVDLFLNRNHVVRLPDLSGLVVAEDGAGMLLLDGSSYTSILDPFHWQAQVRNSTSEVAGAEEALRWAVVTKARREAVLAYLTDWQAKETQYEAERQARRDALVKEYFPDNSQWDQLFPWSQGLIDRVIDAEDARDAVKS